MSASKKHEETLRRQAIDFDQPGTILRDFQTLLDFIGPEGVRATGKYHFLPLDRLFELDEKMSKPLRPPLERPQQRSFPALHGLYLLLRTTQLAVPEGSGRSTGKLVLNPFMLAQWESLNPTERYFNLLEAWLLRSSGETIGKGHARWGRGMFFDVMHCWTSIPKAGSRRRKPSELSLLAYSTSRASNLALLEMFGAVDLELGRPVKGQTWPIRGIRRTEFGEALFEVLYKARGFYALLPYTDELSRVPDDGTTAADADGESDEAEECGEWGEKPREERDFGVWQRWFQPYFPEWQKNLRFQEAEFREGVYYFMVTLGSAWRRIAVPARHTLESLAWAILD
ncbi:MAG: hypothetical protein NUV77_11910, partial [Thermoguttaceae bacterium]|nr:hypothetical protein [Thermoguttaceae bacterium]